MNIDWFIAGCPAVDKDGNIFRYLRKEKILFHSYCEKENFFIAMTSEDLNKCKLLWTPDKKPYPGELIKVWHDDKKNAEEFKFIGFNNQNLPVVDWKDGNAALYRHYELIEPEQPKQEPEYYESPIEINKEGVILCEFIDKRMWPIEINHKDKIGYIFEEAPDKVFDTPIKFIFKSGNIVSYCNIENLKSSKAKPMTLKSVLFRKS